MFCLEVWKEIPAHNFRVLQVILFRGPQPPTEKYLQGKNSLAKSSGPNLLRGQRFQQFETTKNLPKMIQNVSFSFLNCPFQEQKSLTVSLFRFKFPPVQGSSLRRLLVEASLVEAIHDHESLGRSLALWSQPRPIPARDVEGLWTKKFSKKTGGSVGCWKKNTNRHGLFSAPVSKEVGWSRMRRDVCFFSWSSLYKNLTLQGINVSHQTGKGKSSTQNAIFGGIMGDMLVPWRVNFYQLFFALDLFFPVSPVFGISEAMESTDTQVRIPVSGELPGPLDYNSTLSWRPWVL